MVIVVTLLAVLAVIYFWQRTRRSQAPPATDELMVELRNRVLRGTAESFSITPQGRVWGVVMERVRGGHITSVVGLADGNASIYFSHGGGVVAAGGREEIANESRRWCELANGSVNDMLPAREFPFPRPKFVRFFVLTTMGVRTAEVQERVLEKGAHRYSPLFTHGRLMLDHIRHPEPQEARDSA